MAVAVLAAGVALTACSAPVEAGAAAIVGDERISASTLNGKVQELESAVKRLQVQVDPAMKPAQTVLGQMVMVVRYQQILDKARVSVSDGELDQYIAAQGGTAALDPVLVAAGVAPSQVREYIRTSLAAGKLAQALGGGTDQAAGQAGQAKAQALALQIKVTVSPRYGHFDDKVGTFAASDAFGKVAE